MGTSPTVMISSTFYDLSQIRKDLELFLADELSYVPLLSESPSFPIDPDATTIENCRTRVQQLADILVLVVGGRYGFIDETTSKSITNLEYLEARLKGIPIYTFVSRQILSLLPLWETTPQNDFSAAVDTPELFNFVKAIRSDEQSWVFPFDTAQDIINILKTQFAYLFAESLGLRWKFSKIPPIRHFDSISPAARRLLLERDTGWKYLLFLECLIDEISNRSDLLREYRLGLRIGVADEIMSDDVKGWLLARIHEVEGYIGAMMSLVTTSVTDAAGKIGEPGDPDYLIWIARRLGIVYEETLEWILRIRRAYVEEPYSGVVLELAHLPADIIEQLLTFPSQVKAQLLESIHKSRQDGGKVQLEYTVRLNAPDMSKFYELLKKAQAQM